MKIEYRKVVENIVQITTVDERFYVETIKGHDEEGNEDDLKIFYPSVTWITSYYPKGKWFDKWLAEKGWDESQKILMEAGGRGTRVHNILENLVKGHTVRMDDKYFSEKTQKEEEVTVEEWECIMAFSKFFGITNPITVANEITVINRKEKYAGTVDWIIIVNNDIKAPYVEIKRGIYLVDFKTSPNIYPAYEIQVSAYKKALPSALIKEIIKLLTDEQKKDIEFVKDKHLVIKLGILQLGLRTKNGFKFTEIEDKYPLFLSTKHIWANECENIEPRQIDYPVSISLKKEEETL